MCIIPSRPEFVVAMDGPILFSMTFIFVSHACFSISVSVSFTLTPTRIVHISTFTFVLGGRKGHISHIYFTFYLFFCNPLPLSFIVYRSSFHRFTASTVHRFIASSLHQFTVHRFIVDRLSLIFLFLYLFYVTTCHLVTLDILSFMCVSSLSLNL